MIMDQEKKIFFLLALLVLVAVGFVLKVAQQVVVPLVIAWLLTFVVNPVVEAMTKRKIPLPIAILVVIILLLGIGYMGVVFLQGRVVSIISAFPKYEQRMAMLVNEFSSRMDLKYNPLVDYDWARTIRNLLLSLSGSLFSILSNLLQIIVFLVFLLLGKPYSKHKIKRALSDEQAERITRIVTLISSGIGRYLSAQVLISFATGFFVWGALSIIRIDFPMTWGALAFFLNFIPYIGSIVASIPPIILAVVQYYPAIWPFVVTLLAVTSIQMTIGNFIAPKVFGDRLNLSPVVVLLSLLFWGWLWGIVGALLAIPIASAIKITCENIEQLRPISYMMGSGHRYWKESNDANE
ncbi:MAG: AI-2E family transporter [Syntrophales bacterium]|jgi:predicted PurR-regulated permease PerM|nr:AI-2E family transporter [Syntrophales bacterium]MCK9528242.1 AI-2E family transporter [Syntrophales bacterium]MDX9922373.1 AI-2E family transporter [Syntrophales bacterium]